MGMFSHHAGGRGSRVSRPEGGATGERFRTAEEAWFWTCGALAARRDGARSSGSGPKRPCDPDDILLCVERLMTSRRIDRAQAMTMSVWGQRQVAPSSWQGSTLDRRLWSDAMSSLENALSGKGILEETPKQEFRP